MIVRMLGWWVLGICCCNASATEKVFDFGRVKIGSTQTDSIPFTNNGIVDLMISNISIDSPIFGVGPQPFTSDLVLEPDQNVVIPLGFSPQDEQDYSAQLKIATQEGEFAWDLLGRGVSAVVVITEVLADPPTGLDGDSNRDGVRNSNEDEFVEIWNTSNYPVQIGGWQLFDEGASQANRFTFPQGTILNPKAYAVLWGGGNPTDFDGMVFVDDGRIGGGLRNAGDTVFLFDGGANDTIDLVAFENEGGQNASLVRLQGDGNSWQIHNEFPGVGDAFSPFEPRRTFVKLELAPDTLKIAVGDTFTLDAILRISDGSVVALPDVGQLDFNGNSENPVLERVDAGHWVSKIPGVFTGIGAYQGVLRDTIVIQIGQVAVNQLRVSPADTAILVGDAFVPAIYGIAAGNHEIRLAEEFVVLLSDDGILAFDEQELKGMQQGKTECTLFVNELQKTLSVQVVARGDLNTDSQHTLWDAVRLVNIILGNVDSLSNFEVRCADLNQDDVIDLTDLVWTIRAIWGLTPGTKAVIPEARESYVQKDQETWRVHVLPETVAIVAEHSGCQVDAKLLAKSACLVSGFVDGKGTTVILLEGNETKPIEVAFGVDGVDERVTWTGITRNGDAYEIPLIRTMYQTQLHKIYPNPFNPQTQIAYSLSESGQVNIVIFNILGQAVANLVDAHQKAGLHHTVWDGKDTLGRFVSSGTYLVYMQAPNYNKIRKMVVLK